MLIASVPVVAFKLTLELEFRPSTFSTLTVGVALPVPVIDKPVPPVRFTVASTAAPTVLIVLLPRIARTTDAPVVVAIAIAPLEFKVTVAAPPAKFPGPAALAFPPVAVIDAPVLTSIVPAAVVVVTFTVAAAPSPPVVGAGWVPPVAFNCAMPLI